MVVKEIIYKHLSSTSISEFYEGEYWPSQIWNCMRKQYYSRISPIPQTLDSAKITILGTIIHEFIADILKKEENIKVMSEVPVRIPHPSDNIVITGRADDIILVSVGRTRYVIEVKTVEDVEEKKLKRYIPKKEHRAQLNLYLKAFPNSKGILLYVDRGNFEIEEFEVEFDQDLYNETVKRVEDLHNYLMRKTLPSAEAKNNPEMRWQCDYCDYRAKCEREDKH
ncbi:CRISPR-associated protein Cas4 [Acidianus brierleyi]|uniref:PD-(D/E)XK endonuclease-like domain-containing protein n=1 Tax=Acidianus brierleyi TaxID=41673 RepID=A0A2U9IE12_9CREN|nr:PD-(D/E)XK nuclease family protein [Acidianus brierleyi]AWR94174.1 Dna2/Cas4 domain-containing protein [Acidianus brierleyi]